MNSTVRFRDSDDNKSEFCLVFPEDADMTLKKISILSPIGRSLIGYKVGDEIIIPTPKGRKKLTVEEVTYQPERAGDFDR